MDISSSTVARSSATGGYVNTKAFIITRDRVSYSQRCYGSLVQNPLLDVYVVDHGSTYPYMVKWLDSLPYERVLYRGDKRPRDFWEDEFREYVLRPLIGDDTPFIVTDNDVISAVPIDVFRWKALLQAYPERVKVGSSLIIDDIPDTCVNEPLVRTWEHPFWRTEVESHVYDAPIDTTLAMYRKLEPFQLAPAMRDGRTPARHLTWYETQERITKDIHWYRDHLLDGSSHWNIEKPWS
jgi:hypothetical protein